MLLIDTSPEAVGIIMQISVVLDEIEEHNGEDTLLDYEELFYSDGELSEEDMRLLESEFLFLFSDEGEDCDSATVDLPSLLTNFLTRLESALSQYEELAETSSTKGDPEEDEPPPD